MSWSDEFTIDSHRCRATGGKSVRLNKMVAEEGIAHNWDISFGIKGKRIIQTVKVFRNPDESGAANLVGDYCHVIKTPSHVTVGFGSGKDVTFGISLTSSKETASPGYDTFDY